MQFWCKFNANNRDFSFDLCLKARRASTENNSAADTPTSNYNIWVDTLPEHTVLKSREYRQIITFLTRIIDQSFLSEKDMLLTAAGNPDARQTAELAELRERRDSAYIVLEKVLEVVLQELTDDDTVSENAPDIEAMSSLTEIVFPDDAKCLLLKREFKDELSKLN